MTRSPTPDRAARHDKQVARQFIEAFQTGDDAALRAVLVPSAVDHNPLPGQRPARDGISDTLGLYRTAFPDLTVTIENQIAEGDLVFQHGSARGTNGGPLMGAPATGQPAEFAWMDLYRIVDGHITHVWHLEDIAGMMRQLGAANSR